MIAAAKIASMVSTEGEAAPVVTLAPTEEKERRREDINREEEI